MKNLRRLAAATALAGVAVGLVFTGPASSSGATIKVGPTSAGCSGASPADYLHIQNAINAATAGDTVLVCPGTYDEQLTISTSGITVKGVNDPLSGGGKKKKKKSTSCSSLSGLSTSTMAIIRPSTPGDGLTITANDVGIAQLAFRVQDPGSVDLVTDNTHSGTQINKNIFWQIPNIGIDLNSDGTDTTDLEKNCFVGLPGSTHAAIENTSDLSNAKIGSNTFMKNYIDPSTGGAIDLELGGNTTLDHIKIKGNSSTNDGFFLFVAGSTNVSASSNTVSNSNNASFLVDGDNSLLDLESNTISDGHEEGMLFEQGGGAAASTFVSVKDNSIDNAGLTGIDITDTGLTTSLFQSNSVTNGGVDGLRVSGTGNSGLMITSNTLKGNAVHDCHDDSTGAGTGGTANLWVYNDGDTQNIDDLCNGAETNSAGP